MTYIIVFSVSICVNYDLHIELDCLLKCRKSNTTETGRMKEKEKEKRNKNTGNCSFIRPYIDVQIHTLYGCV